MSLCLVSPRHLVRLLAAFVLCAVLLLLPPILAQAAPTPFGSAPVTISPTATTRIEAEDYDKGGEGIAYHDVDNGGSTTYRADNVGVYDDYNASGGFGVGWAFQSEWYAYTLSVAQAGSYALTARLSSGSSGGTFHLEFGPVGQIGTGLFCSASFTVPYASGWNSYQDVTVPAVRLPAGLLWMRVVVDSSYPCNFDFFRVTPVTAAPSVTSLSLSPNPVAGGGSVGASVTLSGPAPVGGTPVTLASDNPAAAPVPSSMVVPAGSNTGYFSFVAGAVTTQTTAHVTASAGGGSASGGSSATAALTVSPSASLLSFDCYSPVPGGQDAYGYLSLNGPAPAGGLSVALTSDSPAASVPATVTVPAGSSFVSVPIATTVVFAQTTAHLQAAAGGVTLTQPLTVSPFGLSYFSLSTDSLHGGEPATGYLYLNSSAPTGGVSVTLTSDNAAATVPASVTVPAGNTYASFPVTTSAVSALTTATITAAGAGSPLTALLTINPPSTPTGLTATAQATGPGTVLVNLSWTAGAGATGYSLERSQDAQSWAQVASPTGTSYQDVSAAAGMTYYYRVKAVSGSGYSNVAYVSTALPYLVATDLEWTPGQPVVGDHVHFYAVIQNVGTAPSAPFTWNVEFEGDPGETGYNIEANPLAPGDTLLVVPPWQSFWTATAGVHHIDVVINNSIISLSKMLVVTPLAPTGLAAASAPGGGINLSWSASPGATSYTLYRSTAAGTEIFYKSGLTGTAFQDAGLTAGQTYFYKVSAVAGWMPSGLSNEASAAPGAGTGAGSISGLDLGFEEPYLGTRYAYNPPGIPWTFTGASGISANRTDVTWWNPPAPEGVQIGFLQGSSSISQPLTSSSAGAWTVTFSAAQRGYSTTGSQTVQVLLDSTLLGTVTPSGTSYSDTTVGPVTLSAGSHTLSFVGTNPDNNNMALLDNVRIHFAPPSQAPPVPTGLTATAVSDSEIDLSWSVTPGTDSYNLYRGTSSGSETLYKSGRTGTSYADTGLPYNTNYYYQVTAVNNGGESGKSSEATTMSLHLSPPAAPTNFQVAAIGDAHAILEWAPVTGASSYDGASFYNVYRKDGNTFKIVQFGVTTVLPAGEEPWVGIPPSSMVWTDTGLTNGLQYTYYVTAVNAAGESLPSYPDTALPRNSKLPPTPTYLAADAISPTSVSITCNNSDTLLIYLNGGYLYRSTSPNGEGGVPVQQIFYFEYIRRNAFVDSGLTPGVTYYYRTSSVSYSQPNIEGPQSEEVSFTAGAPRLPAPAVSSTPSNGIRLSWPAVAGATGYNVYKTVPDAYYSGTDIPAIGRVAATTSNTLSFADIDTVYEGKNTVTYYVAAFNSAGEGPTGSADGSLYGFGILPTPRSVTLAQGQGAAVTLSTPGSFDLLSQPTGIAAVSLDIAAAPQGIIAWISPSTVLLDYAYHPTVQPDYYTEPNQLPGGDLLPEAWSPGATLYIYAAPDVLPGTYQVDVLGQSQVDVPGHPEEDARYYFPQHLYFSVTVTQAVSQALPSSSSPQAQRRVASAVFAPQWVRRRIAETLLAGYALPVTKMASLQTAVQSVKER